MGVEGIAAAVNAGVGLGTSAYNIWASERNRQDFLKQQEFMNNYATNQAQIRRTDLEAAGLHPSLLAGGSASSPPVSQGAPTRQQVNAPAGILESALITKQMQKMDAEIEETLSRAQLNKAEADIKPEDLKVRQGQLAVSRGQLTVALRSLANEIVKTPSIIAQMDASAAASRARALVDRVEGNYMAQKKQHMPTRNLWLQELETLIKQYFPMIKDADASKLFHDFKEDMHKTKERDQHIRNHYNSGGNPFIAPPPRPKS